MDKYIGKRLDARYEIREIIGVGGMAVVYKAYDCIDDRIVAIKILKEEFVRNSEFLTRFRNESKAIAVLSHPNIVKVIDVSFGDNFQYIVMEYIDGINLKEFLERKGALKWTDALYFTVQILRALQHAHDKGIVHRDVKPQNIMLLSDGTIKVTDFGIARFARSSQQTLTDKAIGSVHYISPEQARGNAIDEKADLYSVGVMMYEMLTGQLPFDGDTAVGIALKHMQNEPVPPRKLNPEIPVGIEQIVLRAMRKVPAYRYHSDSEMLHDLEQVRRDPSVTFRYDEASVVDSATRHVDLSAAGITVTEQPVGGAVRIGESASQKIDMLYGTESKGKSKSKPEPEPEMDGYAVIESDRDDDEEVPRRRSSIVPVLAGIAAVLVIVIAFIGWNILSGYFGLGSEGGNTGASVRCPDLVGINYDEACDKNRSLTIVIDRWEISKSEPYGTIISQTEEEGKFLRKDLTVHVVVSSGPPTIVLPDLYEMTEEDAVATLEEMGIGYQIEREKHGIIEEGLVIRTDPKRNDHINEKTVVTITVSEGREVMMVPVPKLTNVSRTKAEEQLKSLGLKIGKVYEKDSQMPQGYVLSQSVEAGKEVAVGTAINITVSTGNGNSLSYDVAFTCEIPQTYLSSNYYVTAYLGTATRGVPISEQSIDFAFTTNQDSGIIKVYISAGPPTETNMGGLYQEWTFKRGEQPVLSKEYPI